MPPVPREILRFCNSPICCQVKVRWRVPGKEGTTVYQLAFWTSAQFCVEAPFAKKSKQTNFVPIDTMVSPGPSMKGTLQSRGFLWLREQIISQGFSPGQPCSFCLRSRKNWGHWGVFWCCFAGHKTPENVSGIWIDSTFFSVPWSV